MIPVSAAIFARTFLQVLGKVSGGRGQGQKPLLGAAPGPALPAPRPWPLSSGRSVLSPPADPAPSGHRSPSDTSHVPPELCGPRPCVLGVTGRFPLLLLPGGRRPACPVPRRHAGSEGESGGFLLQAKRELGDKCPQGHCLVLGSLPFLPLPRAWTEQTGGGPAGTIPQGSRQNSG